MALEGLITCDQGPVLTVVDPSGKELPAFDGMRKFKALFRGADGRDIEATVAYAPEGPEMPHPGLVFRIPGLASADLEGEGLTLNTIDLESAQAARAAGEDVGDVPVGIFDWMSLVDRIAFRVVGDNAARTAPLVLQSCGPAKTERAGAGPGPLDPRK
jgi:hypothetical protein